MLELLANPAFYGALFSVTLLQLALGADNLIIITIIANKLPPEKRKRAIQLGLILAMVFRIVLLAGVSFILQYATKELWAFDALVFGSPVSGRVSGKAAVLFFGGLFLVWKGIKELRVKAKGVHEKEMAEASEFKEVVTVIVGINLLFSVDSILTVVGMTDIFAVMFGAVVISVLLMLVFVGPISKFISENPDFEILGLFVLLLIGFVLVLEGGHVAHLQVGESSFPYIPQWIVIFMLLFIFAVDLYQNWHEKRRVPEVTEPVHLHRRRK